MSTTSTYQILLVYFHITWRTSLDGCQVIWKHTYVVGHFGEVNKGFKQLICSLAKVAADSQEAGNITPVSSTDHRRKDAYALFKKRFKVALGCMAIKTQCELMIRHSCVTVFFTIIFLRVTRWSVCVCVCVCVYHFYWRVVTFSLKSADIKFQHYHHRHIRRPHRVFFFAFPAQPVLKQEVLL